MAKIHRACILFLFFAFGFAGFSFANDFHQSKEKKSLELSIIKISTGYVVKKPFSGKKEMVVIDSISRSGKKWVRERKSIAQPEINSVQSIVIEVVFLNEGDVSLEAEIGANIILKKMDGLRAHQSFIDVNIAPGTSTKKINLLSVADSTESENMLQVIGPPSAAILSISTPINGSIRPQM